MFRLPGTNRVVAVNAQELVAIRRRIIIVKVIHHLFDTHSISRDVFFQAYKAADIAIGGAVYIQSKIGSSILHRLYKLVLVNSAVGLIEEGVDAHTGVAVIGVGAMGKPGFGLCFGDSELAG